MSRKVFLSYSSKDQKIAAGICAALESRGHPCWMSSRDVKPGENFQGAIVRAIRDAGVMVMVFSSNANNSDEIKKEMALASQCKLMVIPVRAEDVLPSEDFTYELATRQWIDMFNDWDCAIDQLGRQIDVAMPGVAVPVAATPSAAPKGNRRRLPLFAGVAAIVLASGAAAFWLTRPSSPPPQAPPATRTAAAQPTPPPAAMDPVKLESDLWDSVKDSDDATALRSYLAKYPDGVFAAAARAKLAALKKAAPARTAPIPPAAPAKSDPAQSQPQAVPASTSVSPPGTALNAQVQQAVNMGRLAEQRARALAQKAEVIASQAQSGAPGFGIRNGRGASRWAGRLAAEHTGGLGVITYANGDRYAGGTRDDKRFGMGIFTGASNRIYRERVGQFVADELDGYAVVYRRDGRVRVGQWKNGVMNGYGALLDGNGGVLEQGLYADDKLATPMKGD
ncbi:MAG TPA: TIR domain-containing protein [Rhizomicrobium sp.]|jgi:hypothetical protein